MIFVIRLVSNRRRLLRKRMYISPYKRQRRTYVRQNKNLNKNYQKDYVNNERIITKRRPKREVMSGFKMSYRYKYYAKNDENEGDEE